ncbi:uncharacterized protein LOC135366633 isoform X2 [Ornithodoros turicata]|uniref:uncharacterized protein LOC135366633 isoform X2 n=1 Tax=Ornithodoros turicata TaxID=34597 RepID=UPI0031399F3D
MSPSVMQCCVRGCVNNGTKVNSQEVHLYRIPRSEPLRSQWLELIDWQGPPPNTKTRVCNLHFDTSDYYHNPIALRSVGMLLSCLSRLKTGVLPSLNLPCTNRPSKRQRTDDCPADAAERVSAVKMEPNFHNILSSSAAGVHRGPTETVEGTSYSAAAVAVRDGTIKAEPICNDVPSSNAVRNNLKPTKTVGDTSHCAMAVAEHNNPIKTEPNFHDVSSSNTAGSDLEPTETVEGKSHGVAVSAAVTEHANTIRAEPNFHDVHSSGAAGSNLEPTETVEGTSGSTIPEFCKAIKMEPDFRGIPSGCTAGSDLELTDKVEDTSPGSVASVNLENETQSRETIEPISHSTTPVGKEAAGTVVFSLLSKLPKHMTHGSLQGLAPLEVNLQGHQMHLVGMPEKVQPILQGTAVVGTEAAGTVSQHASSPSLVPGVMNLQNVHTHLASTPEKEQTGASRKKSYVYMETSMRTTTVPPKVYTKGVQTSRLKKGTKGCQAACLAKAMCSVAVQVDRDEDDDESE